MSIIAILIIAVAGFACVFGGCEWAMRRRWRQWEREHRGPHLD